MNQLENLMDSTLKNIKNMVDVNTIIGEPIKANEEVTIIPVSRVAFGFGSGGSSFSNSDKKNESNFGGGVGGGVSISPVAFLIVSKGGVKMINVDQSSPLDRLVDMAPDVLGKIISKFPKKSSEEEVSTTEEE